MIVPISDRARKYGYMIWPKSADQDVQALMSEIQKVKVSFNGSDLGEKRVDWKHRRISIGPSQTRSVSETAKSFRVEFSGHGLSIVTE